MHKHNPALHRYAVLLAASTVLLFVTGTVVTSNEERPGYAIGQTHEWFGAAVTLLLAGLAIWLWRVHERVWLHRFVLIALGVNIVQDVMGIEADPLQASVRIFHALLAQLFFSATVAIAVFTSASWDCAPEPAGKAPQLRFLAMAAPVVVMLQIVLGTAFRHGVMGLGPHLLWALFVGIFLIPVIAAIFATGRPELRSAGVALGVIVAVQILLGFTVFTMQAVEADPTVLIVATSIHAAIGSFTLAATVTVAILVRRIVRPRSASPISEAAAAEKRIQ